MSNRKPKKILEAENSFRQATNEELQKLLDLAHGRCNELYEELKQERLSSQEARDWAERLTKQLDQKVDEAAVLRVKNQALLTVIKIFAERESLAKIWG